MEKSTFLLANPDSTVFKIDNIFESDEELPPKETPRLQPQSKLEEQNQEEFGS